MGAFTSCLKRANKAYEKGFGRLGSCLGHRPCLSLGLTILCTVALCIGLVSVKLDADILKSFIPYHSRYRAENDFVNDQFSARNTRTSYISAYMKDGSDIITPAAMREWRDVNVQIDDIKYTYDGVDYYRDQLCSRTNPPDLALGLFESGVLEQDLANFRNEPLKVYGLPCTRYSTIDCFDDGKFDYYKAHMTTPLSNAYFPYYDTSSTPPTKRYSYVPWTMTGVPNTFLNSSGTDARYYKAKRTIDSLTDANEIKTILNQGCYVWADVRLPPDIIMGGRETADGTQDGQLVSAKTFLMAFFLLDVESLGRQLQFQNCSSACRQNVRDYTGSCIGTALQQPFSQLALYVGACAANSAIAYKGCRVGCDYRATDYWKSRAEDILLGWEDAFLARVEGVATTAAGTAQKKLGFHYLAGKSAGDAAGGAVVGDLIVIVIGFIVAFIYSLLILARWHSRWSRCLLMLGGVGLLVLSIGAALGLASAIGVSLTIQIIQVLPFLVIGLGLTDMFVMMYTFQYDDNKSLEEMASATLVATGPSHAMISGTSILVFGIASTMDFPVIRTFCHAVLLAITITYLVVVFGFLPLLIFDGRRMKSGRSDCLPCMRHDEKHHEHKVEPRDRLRIGKTTARYMEKMPLKIAILVGFTALLVLSCLNISTIGQNRADLPASQFIPKSSYVSGFLGDLDNYYSEFPHSLVMGMDRDGNAVDFDYPGRLEELIRFLRMFARTVEGVDRHYDFTSGWAESYWKWANRVNNNVTGDCQVPLYNCTNLVDTSRVICDLFEESPTCTHPINPDAFYGPRRGLQAYLEGSTGSSNIGQLNLTATGRIQSATNGFVVYGLNNADKFFSFIRQSRALTDATNMPIFPSGWAFSLYESNQTTLSSLGPLMGWLVLGVALTMAFFVLHPGAMCIALAHVIMMTAEVYGLMSTMSIRINAVSISNLVMCVYIGVLQTGYVTRAFMRVDSPDRQVRATSAFLSVAPPVLHGSIGIFVTVISLAFAALPYFNVYFFQMYVLIVFIGIGNALVLLPTVLSLIGPEPTSSSPVQRYTEADAPGPEATGTNGKGNGNGTGNGKGNGHAKEFNKGETNDQVVEMGAGQAGAD